MNVIEWILFAWLTPALVAAPMGAFFCAIESPAPFHEMPVQGRAVAGFFAGALWPLFAVLVLVKWAIFVGAGFAQIFRFMFPRKPQLPRMRVRR